MLVLTLNLNEKVCIGDEISVTVLEVHGRQAHLGINAPKTVRVDRQEIHERRLREPAVAHATTDFKTRN